MSDMKVRIIIDDGNGATRTATLSFEEESKDAKKSKEKEATLLDRLREMQFTVREGITMLEPGMIGELHLEEQDGPRERCCSCGKKTWILMEVIEDDTEEEDPDYPFINVDHDLIGEICIACGHQHINEDMVGSGVFGLLDDEVYPKFQDFLDDIEKDPPDQLVRSHLLQALIAQERMHMKAVYRIRQRIMQMRVDKCEAEVTELASSSDEEEGKE